MQHCHKTGYVSPLGVARTACFQILRDTLTKKTHILCQSPQEIMRICRKLAHLNKESLVFLSRCHQASQAMRQSLPIRKQSAVPYSKLHLRRKYIQSVAGVR